MLRGSELQASTQRLSAALENLLSHLFPMTGLEQKSSKTFEDHLAQLQDYSILNSRLRAWAEYSEDNWSNY